MQAISPPLYNLPIGTVLGRSKGLLQHQGIYMGNGMVFENTQKFGERMSTYAEFAEMKAVRVVKAIELSTSEIYKRVGAALQQKRAYCPVTNNCEQSVNRIALGFGWSWQVIIWGVVAVGAIASLVFMLRRK